MTNAAALHESPALKPLMGEGTARIPGQPAGCLFLYAGKGLVIYWTMKNCMWRAYGAD